MELQKQTSKIIAAGWQDILSDELRVLVMRRWPMEIRRADIDLWLPNLAPKRGYRANDKCSELCYLQQLSEQGQALADLKELASLHGTLALLCVERHEQCHRFVLKAVLDELG